MPFAEIQNNSVHYSWLDYDREETVVFINSLGTNFTIWNQMLPFFTNTYNILLHDKRGHGFSSYPNGETCIDDYADDIITLMDHCGIKKAHVVGLSIGGLIAYSLAERHPKRIKKLIFSNTGFKIGTSLGWEERILDVEENGLQSISDMVMQRWFSADFRASQASQVIGYMTLLTQTTKPGYLSACKAIAKADYAITAKNMGFEALFIGGKHDLSTPPEFVKKMSEQTKGSKYIEMPDVGHLPCLENPLAYAEHIINFIG
ncbi:MAG: 3-oxoadipate enol-lactonase [Allomuricauda sp.]|nr:MAG: 3-oxoadipate enol-lactonase [Allomuricauda sp.]